MAEDFFEPMNPLRPVRAIPVAKRPAGQVRPAATDLESMGGAPFAQPDTFTTLPGPWVQLYVWMASWQMECCGTPFREDAEVSWRLRHPGSAELAWIDTVLHDGVAATIDAVEDHHGDASAPLTTVTVASIATLHCRFVPEPVAESGLMTSVATAEKWNDDLGDRHFAGFLVRVLPLNWVRL